MIVEFVNSLGFSLAVCQTPSIIERYRNTEGFFEVPVCTESFIKRKWDFENEIWIEGATAQEIEEILQSQKDSLLEVISVKVDELNTRALSSALGLKGSRQFLESQKVIYDRKANVANGTNDAFMDQTIADQMERDYPNEIDLDNALIALGLNPVGTKSVKYRNLIKKTNENFYASYNKFLAHIEDFRTLCTFHLKNNDFVKAQAVIDVAESVPLEVDDTILTNKRAEAFNI